MTTHFITAEIALSDNPAHLHQEIIKELEKQGEPLRWGITQVDQDKQQVRVEAVVTNTK